MCNTNCNNKPCCCEEDLLCCMPVVHCCGGYSEHNNCCPHDRCCNRPVCGQCCDPCDKCDQPMCCCCYKLKKAFDEFKDETKASVTSLEGRLERLEVKEGDDYIYLLGQITNLAQKEQDDVDRLDGKIDSEIQRATAIENQIAADSFADADYVNDANGARILFKNKAGVVLDQIDARPFIKDGMLDSVSLIDYQGDKGLKIVFNTDAGKQDIIINIGDLFEADDYYTKSYINNNYYTKGNIDGTVSNLNGSILGVRNDLANHIGDTTKHITAAERTQWNAAEPNVLADWTEPNSSSDAFIKNKPTLATVATTGNYNDLTNKPTLGTASAKNVPTSGNASTTQVVMGNDSRLTDARTPVAHTHTVSDITNFPTKVSTFTNDAGYLTQHLDISGKANRADLATVATSGDYNDLINTPATAANQNVTYGGNSVTILNAINNIVSRIATLEGKQYWTRSNGNLTPATSTDTVTASAFYDSSVS